MHEPLKLCDSLLNAGIANGFVARQYGEAFGYPLFALLRPAPGKPRVYLSSGIHGDEPAAVHAMLKLLEDKALPPQFDYTLCPLINPTGISLAQRENADGIDLNRDFFQLRTLEIRSLIAFIDSIDPLWLSLCLHEDWEATGFYLYSLGRPNSAALGRSILDHLRESQPIESASQIDGFEASDGLIAPLDEENHVARDDLPEALYLFARQHHIHLTLETPSSLPLEQRVAMHVQAVLHCLANAHSA